MQNLQHLLAAAKKNKPVTRVSRSADSMRSQGASKHDPKKTCGAGLQVENARMLRAKFTELQASILSYVSSYHAELCHVFLKGQKT